MILGMVGMIEYNIEIRDKEFRKAMSALAKQNADLRPLFKRYQVIMIRSFNQNFKQEGRPKKWKPLSPSTVANRRKGSKRILQDTGQLRASCAVESAPGNITRFRKNSLVMGTNLKTAKWHQDGTDPYTITPRHSKYLRFATSSGWRFARQVHHPGLPARPFIMIHDEDEKQMIEEAEKFSVDVMENL